MVHITIVMVHLSLMMFANIVLTYKIEMIMEKNEKSQERKKGRVNGSRTQKVYSFRLDEDLIGWLDTRKNKGRYLNELIRDDFRKILH